MSVSRIPTQRTPPSGVRGVGIDLVDIDRLGAVLTRRRRMTERLFTETERAYADAAPTERSRLARLAARFAAKEAVMKALSVGIGSMRFADICVVRGPGGEPTLELQATAQALAASRGVTAWHLSLSHTELVAVAVAVAS